MSRNRNPSEFIERLTPTQRLYLYLAACGLSDSDIAGQRRCSTRSVDNVIHKAHKRLGVHSRVQAWSRLGWLNPVLNP